MLSANGAAGTIFNYQWELDPRSVIITCNPIEVSGNYHKGANNLPEANLRNSDGSMMVDTIPTWMDEYSWVLNQDLFAATSGFDITSSNPLGTLTNTQIDWTPAASLSNTVDNYIRADGTNAQLPYTYTSHVKVKDLRPNMDATAENDYTINIHKPFENGKESAPRVFDHNVKYPWSTQIIGGANATVDMVDQQPREWSLMGQSLNNVFGSFLSGVCGSGALALFVALDPEAAIIADMVFNAIGWVVQISGTPEPTHTGTVTGDLAAFTNAISEQQTIDANNGSVILNDMGIDCPEDTRIRCGDSLSRIAADLDWYWNFGNPKGKCHKGDRYIKYTVTGDGYGVNGYTGRQTNYPVVQERKLENVWEWTVDAQPKF